jgi:hypothetical protein
MRVHRWCGRGFIERGTSLATIKRLSGEARRGGDVKHRSTAFASFIHQINHHFRAFACLRTANRSAKTLQETIDVRDAVQRLVAMMEPGIYKHWHPRTFPKSPYRAIGRTGKASSFSVEENDSSKGWYPCPSDETNVRALKGMR